MAETIVGERIAREFHDTYEQLAPSFGYETRKDTKAFDPASPNGRLMIAVCEEVTRSLRDEVRRLREWIKRRGHFSDCDYICTPGLPCSCGMVALAPATQGEPVEKTIGERIAHDFFAGPLYEKRLAQIIDYEFGDSPAEPTPKVRRFRKDCVVWEFADTHGWLTHGTHLSEAILWVKHKTAYEIDASGNRIETPEVKP